MNTNRDNAIALAQAAQDRAEKFDAEFGEAHLDLTERRFLDENDVR